jgi:hypothetical protein
VPASINKVPAGVIGRPSLAGSCWPLAFLAQHKQIRKKPIFTGDLIGPSSPLPRFFFFGRSHRYQSTFKQAKGKIISKTPKAARVESKQIFPGNAFDPNGFYF